MNPGRAAARDSIHGLALGDAFGERWFPLMRTPAQAFSQIQDRQTPSEPDWHWTDDTAMALSVLRALYEHGEIHPDHLARSFAQTYLADPARGYGYGMHQLLPELAEDPAAWRTAAGGLFDGQGSLGNGAAMRAAPLGAWFHDDLDHAIAQATLAAQVWSAAHHQDSLTDALWTTAEGLGDVDTTCAITGGIVAARTGLTGVPDTWLSRREPLPGWVDTP